MTRTPFLISIMLACYVNPDAPWDHLHGGIERWTNPECLRLREWVFDNELIDLKNHPTDKGKAWVRAICETPLPIATWTLPGRDDSFIAEFAE